MVEIERDGRVGIDLKFGTITFQEHADGAHAVALIDVIIPTAGPQPSTRVQLEVKIPVDPEVDPILGITERCRTHIVATLRAAADTFDTATARALLFHGGTAVAAE